MNSSIFQSTTDNNNDERNDRQDGEALKKKREEHAVEIRRKEREERFAKIRKVDNSGQQNMPQQQPDSQSNNTTIPQTAQMIPDPNLRTSIDNYLKRTFSMSDFLQLVEAINSNDIQQQHFGVIGLRKILSVEDGPPIQTVIDANLVPRLIDFIKQDTHQHLQLEAAWALTNVASGTSHQTQAMIDKGAIPLFCALLNSPHADIAEQAIWALGNIAGDCAIYRDIILKCGGIDPLIKIIETTQNKSTVKHGTWALSNLCRGRPLPNFELVKNAIPTLSKVIKEESDSEVLTDACWALSYLSDGEEERINLVIQTQVIPSLIQRLDHPYLSILIPTLRTLGNIVTGNDSQTNEVIQYGALDKFFKLLDHEKKAVRREACWALSNVTAGNAQQITLVVEKPEWVAKLNTLISSDCAEIRREAAWVISNATNQGNPSDVEKLVNMGVLSTFVSLLECDDVKTVAVVLEAINNILNCGKINFMDDVGEGKMENRFVLKLEQLQAVPKIEKLQTHPNMDVYLRCVKILEKFFEIEELI